MALDALMRRTILNVAGNRAVTALANRYGMRLGAARFVSGNEIEDAIGAIRALNDQGMATTLDHLGESVDDPSRARAAAQTYLEVLDRVESSGVDSNVSVKLTQMGLDIDHDLCLENMNTILERASQYDNFVRIDMEDSEHTEPTIQVYEELVQAHNNVGLVLQAYLYRTEADIERLNKVDANLRLCKGAYNEPANVAFPKKEDVDRNFRQIIAQHLHNGNYTCIATHDERVIAFAKKYVMDHKIPNDQFEFQMLYGIRRDLQQQLADQGYRVRIYVPFGTEWYPYFTRRLAERPANVFFILKNMLRP